MKSRIIALAILFVFLASFIPAYAQEETATDDMDTEVEQVLEDTTLPEDEAGLTPDKAGWHPPGPGYIVLIFPT